MGADIYAFVEVKRGDRWDDFLKVYLFRDYDMFCALFGVRCFLDVEEPLFPRRGFPEDADVFAEVTYKDSGGHSATWVTFREFKKAKDLNVKVDDLRVHIYKREGNKWIYEGKAAGIFSRGKSITRAAIEDTRAYYDPEGDKLYIVEREEVALTPEWEDLYAVMAALADRYGEDNVRLVVWFSD